LAALFAQRRIPLIGLALSAGVLGAYISYLIVVVIKAEPTAAPCSHGDHSRHQPEPGGSFAEATPPTGLPPDISRATAAEFDASLDFPEWTMGITKLRRLLAGYARGHVLEVAVGTGRNMAYFDWDDVSPQQDPARRKLRALEKQRLASSGKDEDEGESSVPDGMISYTGVDISGDVLEVARGRLRKSVPGGTKLIKKRLKPAWGTGPADEQGRIHVLDANEGRLRLIKSDAQAALPLPAAAAAAASASGVAATSSPPPKYDTILQTFGLCSVTDPTHLLTNLASVLQPGTGRLVLLEHGRGRWAVVNRLLDRYAPAHFARFGCWWNRDVEHIVREAAASVPGLEVVRVHRPGWAQFGTMLWIELVLAKQEGT